MITSCPFPLQQTPTATHKLPLPPTEISANIQIRIPSPSGKFLAVIRADNDSKDNESPTASQRQILEIWTMSSSSSLIRRIPLPTNKLHGRVMNDAPTFGRAVWSPDQTVLAYAAERPTPETTSFFDSDSHNGNNKMIPEGQHTLGLGKSEHWGEQFYSLEPLLDLFLVNTTRDE